MLCQYAMQYHINSTIPAGARDLINTIMRSTSTSGELDIMGMVKMIGESDFNPEEILPWIMSNLPLITSASSLMTTLSGTEKPTPATAIASAH